jgi:hypothetical protein
MVSDTAAEAVRETNVREDRIVESKRVVIFNFREFCFYLKSQVGFN